MTIHNSGSVSGSPILNFFQNRDSEKNMTLLQKVSSQVESGTEHKHYRQGDPLITSPTMSMAKKAVFKGSRSFDWESILPIIALLVIIRTIGGLFDG